MSAAQQEKEKLNPAKDQPILGSLMGTEKLLPDAIPLSLRPDVSARVLDIATAGGEFRLLETVGSKRKAGEAQIDAPTATAGGGSTSDSAQTSAEETSSPEWFQQAAVSAFEEAVLGATCTADPADYLKIRNGIIALCAQSPLQYITGTECRRKLPGDVNKILQVHEFLNAFALINARARLCSPAWPLPPSAPLLLLVLRRVWVATPLGLPSRMRCYWKPWRGTVAAVLEVVLEVVVVEVVPAAGRWTGVRWLPPSPASSSSNTLRAPVLRFVEMDLAHAARPSPHSFSSTSFSSSSSSTALCRNFPRYR